MKIVLTGSLGNISLPLAKLLIQKGHAVTIISRRTENVSAIEALGAQAAIGTMNDADFLAETFKDSDVIYTMGTLDHKSFFDPDTDIMAAMSAIAHAYKDAISRSEIKKVVHLSSIGAHTNEGNGNLAMHYNAEGILNELPDDVAIKFMRPAGFYTNLLRQAQTIKAHGTIISNYAGDKKEPWVSPVDIAAAIAEKMEKPFEGREVHYVVSDEISPDEIAEILGAAISNPDLKWVAISNEQLLNNMISVGMNTNIAKGFVEMQAAQGTGLLYEDYYRNKPLMGQVKLVDFAQDFASVYNNL